MGSNPSLDPVWDQSSPDQAALEHPGMVSPCANSSSRRAASASSGGKMLPQIQTPQSQQYDDMMTSA